MHKAFDKLKAKFDDYQQQQQQPMGGAPPGHMQHNVGGVHHVGGVRAVYPQQGQSPPGPGTIPPKVANVSYKGAMRFFLPSGQQHDVARDLGYTGIIDGKVVWTFGDTLMGKNDNAMICATDSTAIGSLSDPMSAVDTALYPGTNNVANWINCNQAEEADGGLSCYAFGGTNVVETAPNQGLVYFLKNHRPGGSCNIKGAGVATVHMEGDIPKSQRVADTTWTDSEPAWGDVGIAYNSKDQHVYAYGHGPSFDKELPVRTYLCRAPASGATDVQNYEYWDNSVQQWTRTRLGNGEMGTIRTDKQHAVFEWMVMNQSAPFWSNYFNCWMFLHGSCFGFSDIICRTADKLEGPWTEHGIVASTLPEGEGKGDQNGQGFRYCQTGHPEFDPSGKTVLVTWTRNNIIYGSVIEWQ